MGLGCTVGFSGVGLNGSVWDEMQNPRGPYGNDQHLSGPEGQAARCIAMAYRFNAITLGGHANATRSFGSKLLEG
jgi:hypothetical protein